MTNKFRHINAIICTLALIFSAGPVSASEDCVFDPDAFSVETYQKNPETEYVKWMPNTKTAQIITKTGMLVSIVHWSCNHYGLQANALVEPNAENMRDQILELSRLVLDKPDFELVNAQLKNTSISLHKPFKLHIPNDEYAEFYVETYSSDSYVVISIKFYKN